MKLLLSKLCFMAFGIALSVMIGCSSGVKPEHIQILVEKNSALESEIETMQSDMDKIRQDVEAGQKEIAVLKDSEQEQKQRLENELSMIQEALKRAESGNNLSKGKLLYEVTISDASVEFAFNKSGVSERAMSALDNFAGILISENKGVYIEIQGHTDNIGRPAYNLRLGQSRADAIRRYFHVKHGIPLNRMSAFSYGESKPIADNTTPEGRAKNRRVVILVME